jgi:transcriptional regulator with XRE-family HTH domain
MNTNNKYSNKVRQVRKARGLKQVELAAISGVSLPLLNRVENWHLPVSSKTAQRLADALGVAIGEVFPHLVAGEVGKEQLRSLKKEVAQ